MMLVKGPFGAERHGRHSLKRGDASNGAFQASATPEMRRCGNDIRNGGEGMASFGLSPKSSR